jgi:hypothetical protein
VALPVAAIAIRVRICLMSMNVPVMDEPSTYALSRGLAIAIHDGHSYRGA